MLIRKGNNAVNIVTDRWLDVPEDINMEINDTVVLANQKKYEVIGFFGNGYVKVGPAKK